MTLLETKLTRFVMHIHKMSGTLDRADEHGFIADENILEDCCNI